MWRPARWANWMFDTKANPSPSPNTNPDWMFDTKAVDGGNFTFGRGGNQGARGSNTGGDFFVQNLFEELDHPGEYCFDMA